MVSRGEYGNIRNMRDEYPPMNDQAYAYFTRLIGDFQQQCLRVGYKVIDPTFGLYVEQVVSEFHRRHTEADHEVRVDYARKPKDDWGDPALLAHVIVCLTCKEESLEHLYRNMPRGSYLRMMAED